jgi:DNA repair exonuclease SbcCD ATPase subunit
VSVQIRSQGTVSNIIHEFKKGVQNTDYESVLELTTHCKSEGFHSLSELTELVRLNNYIKRVGADEERVEQLISVCLARDPQKIIEVVEKIGYIDTDVPLEQLEENIHQRQAELLRLQQEISEARATIESVNDDRQTIQEYKELKGGMNNLQLKEKISNVFRSFKIYGYDGWQRQREQTKL